MHDRGKRSQTVAINAAITLSLHLILRTFQHVREGLHLIHPLAVLRQTGYNKRIVVVAIKEFVLGVSLNVSHPRKLGIEDGGIDALRTVIRINQTLKTVDDFD